MKNARRRIFEVTVLAACFALAPRFARAAAQAIGTPYSPVSQSFSCLLPKDWTAFEEEDGALVHFLGPQDPAGNYRTVVDIRIEREGYPSFRPYKDEVKYLRDGDEGEKVDSTVIQALRVSGALARYFESNVTRTLPNDSLPATAVTVHHFTAFVPLANSQSYYLIDLSCPESAYLDYRQLFISLLKSFRAS